MISRWRRLVSLAPREQRLFWAAALLIPISKLVLRLLPLSVLRNLLRRCAARRRTCQDSLPVDRIVWAVGAAARPWRARCVPQALSAYILLRWYGWPAQLRIGVVKESGQELLAHAWVESDGRVAIGDGANLGKFTLLLAIE